MSFRKATLAAFGVILLGIMSICSEASAANIPMPSGYYRYCSYIVPSSSGQKWRFVRGTTDPCPTSTVADANVRAAGYYNGNGINQVIGRCGSSLSNLTGASYAVRATGGAALDAVENWLWNNTSYPYCEIKVAPEQLPIFDAPMETNPLPSGWLWGQNMPDFATPNNGAYTFLLQPSDYGQVAHYGPNPSPCSSLTGYTCELNFKGQDMRWGQSGAQVGQFSIGEKAIDTMGGQSFKDIRAMADGQVWAVRARDVSGMGCYSSLQYEAYVIHRVGSESYDRYVEMFMVYYAHLNDFLDDSGQTWGGGDLISKGDRIGRNGRTGCTGGYYHVHFGVNRLTNATRANSTTKPWRVAFNTTPNVYGGGALPDNFVSAIDPFGWKAPDGVDPGGAENYDDDFIGYGPNGTNTEGGGAMSIDLYSGAGFPRPCDGYSGLWNMGGGTFTANPYRTCN